MGDDEQLVRLASDVGYGFISNLGNLKSKTKSGKNAITLPSKSKVMKIVLVEDLESQYVAVATNRGRLLIFPIAELPLLSKGKGNKLIQIPATDLTVRKELITGLCALMKLKSCEYIMERERHFISLRIGFILLVIVQDAEKN